MTVMYTAHLTYIRSAYNLTKIASQQNTDTLNK